MAEPPIGTGPHIRLTLFGPFRATDATGTELAPLGRSAIALLAHLALAGRRPVTRDRLATLLWPDRGSEQARHSLRQTLLVARRILDGAAGRDTILERDGLTLDHEIVESDVEHFEVALASGEPAARAAALALYQAPLLDGFDARSSLFEDWLVPERARLHDKAMAAFEEAVTEHGTAGETEALIALAERALALEPAHEAMHRALISVHIAAGRREAALRQFEQCRDALSRRLDAQPAAETLELKRRADALRSSVVPPAPRMEAPAGAHHLVSQPEAVAPTAAPPASLDMAAPESGAARAPAGRRRRAIGAVALAAVAIAAAILLWQSPWAERAAPTSQAAKMAFPLPDKPSLAVLPFRTDGESADLPAIADGLTEDINASLLTVSRILVISRVSILALQQQGVDATGAAERLGVRYLLEGTVRRSGDRLRVTAQLTDAIEGKYVWAERYERQLGDVFALQDGIVQEIITALQVSLTEGEQERHRPAAFQTVDAWLRSGKALQALRRLNRDGMLEARRLYEEILETDPNNAGSYEGLAWTHFLEARFQWSPAPAESIAKAAELVQKAIAMDPGWGRAYALLAQIALLNNDLTRAVALGDQAVALGPNDSEAMAMHANTLTYAGELARAEALMQDAMRRSPYYPDWYAWNLGRVLRLQGRHAEAVAVLEARLGESLGSYAQRVELAIAQVGAGQMERAKATAAAVMRANPAFTITMWLTTPGFRDSAMSLKEGEALRALGLPE